MCENNTLFLSRAWRYFKLNGHTVDDGNHEVDLVFIGGCAVTDAMRDRCQDVVLKAMRRFGRASFIVFGCLAAFPEGLQSAINQFPNRLHVIPYEASHRLDELIHARIPVWISQIHQLQKVDCPLILPKTGVEPVFDGLPDMGFELLEQDLGPSCLATGISTYRGTPYAA